jgi:isocitrate dehydrogenase
VAKEPGTFTMVFKPTDAKKAPVDMQVYKFDGPGVLMGMYNTDESIYGFAHSSF